MEDIQTFISIMKIGHCLFTSVPPELRRLLALFVLGGVAATLAAPDPTSPLALYPPLDTFDAGHSWGHKQHVSVSGANGGFLAVWSDNRANRTSLEFGDAPADDAGQQDLYATRMSSDGTALDLAGIPLATGSAEELSPAVASDGVDTYLVAWEEASADGGHRVAARRAFTDAGLGPSFSVTASGPTPLRPAVSFADGRFLIVWGDGAQALARAYEVEGQPVGASPLSLGAAASAAAPAAAGFAGQGHLAAWERPDGGLALSLIGSAGPSVLAAPDVSAAAGLIRNPTVAASFGRWMVAFETGPDGNPDVYGLRINSAGVLEDTTPFALTSGVQRETLPRLAFNGADYLVLWEDSRSPGFADINVYRSRVGSDGTVRDPGGVAVEDDYAPQLRPAVACQGASCLQLWVDKRMNTDGLLVEPLNGVAAGIKKIAALAPHAQREPRMSCLDGNCLLSWCDNGSFNSQVRVTRLGDGALGAPVGLPLSTDLGFCSTSPPSSAASPTGHFVAYHDNSRGYVLGRLLQRDGTLGPVLDVNDRTDNSGDQVVVYGANGYLAVFHDRRPGSTGFNGLYFRRFDLNGNPLGSPAVQLSTVSGFHVRPAVAFSGGVFLVVWVHRENISDFWVRARRVRDDGTVLDPAPIQLGALYTEWPLPALAPATNGFVVLWSDNTSGTATLRGTTVWIDGGVAASAGDVLFPSSLPQRRPSVVWDNGRGLAVFEQGQANQVSLQAIELESDGGTLSGSARFSLGDPRYEYTDPSVALAEPGRALLAYVTFDSSPTTQALRAQVRSIALGRPGDTCVTNSGCQVGLCVIGRCAVPSDAGVVSLPDGGTAVALPDGGFGFEAPFGLALRVGCGCGALGVPTFSFAVLVALLVLARRRPPR
ncbi:MAG: hypothetical protein ACT4TC_00690 [Myxococcaceae bacterium]